MSKFLERYASLKGIIDWSSYPNVFINVEDPDEALGRRIMYMDITIAHEKNEFYEDPNYEEEMLEMYGEDWERNKDLGPGNVQYIWVNVVDFEDEVFFNLPQQKQDKCALVLFKTFIKWYKENYGKDSENGWVPVHASFANYELQEKFQKAVDQGIFPEKSMENSDTTTKERWEAQPQYNMDNRKIVSDMEKNPQKYFPNLNIVDGMLMDTPISVVHQDVMAQAQTYPFLTTMFARGINGRITTAGEVYITLPFMGKNDERAFGSFYVKPTLDMIEFVNLTDDNLPKLKGRIAQNPNNVKQVLDTVTQFTGTYGEWTRPLDDLFRMDNDQQITAKRLVRK